MASIRVNTESVEWTSGVPFYGPGAMHDGREIVLLKILSDRRREGGGIAWLARFLPPPGKLIKIVAVALSDEHVLDFEGGRGTKGGQPARGAGDYSLNPKGQPHSAMIVSESVSLVVYTGGPDEIVSLEVVPIEAAG